MFITSTKQAARVQAYSRTLKDGEKLASMKGLMDSGQVQAYAQEGDTITIYSSHPEAIGQLPIEQQARFDVKKKIVDFVKPQHLERDCAPEYASYRRWNLGASVLNGVMGFMASQTYLDAQNASYSDSEAVALSGVVTGTLGKITQMGASPLAKWGDADPRNSYLRSQLVATGCTSLGLGVLGALPGAHFPVFCATSIAGTVGGTIGSAAGANIFSHLVPGPSKGDVVAKGQNQELIASLWGMPIGLLLGRAAKAAGLAPGVLAASLLGPLKAFCHLQATRSLRMSPAGNRELSQLTNQYLDTGAFPESPKQTLGATLKGLFKFKKTNSELNVPFVPDINQVLKTDPKFTLQEFAHENYLLGLNKEGEIQVALRADSKSEDTLRACLHHGLLERALGSGLPEALKGLGREDVQKDLVKLTHRALPEKAVAVEAASKRGWHLSTHNINVPTVQAQWTAPESKDKQSRINGDIFKRLLVEKPDTKLLGQLLDSLDTPNPV
jgi:Vitamin B6 photo-protection and homoeostasis